MFFPKPRDGSVQHFISLSRKKKNSVSLCDNYSHRVDPKTLSKFRTLTKLGGELRKRHLLESPTVERYITQYPRDGSNVVGKPRFVIANGSEAISNGETPLPRSSQLLAVTGRVYINETQYFANVPLITWSFYIGRYQPAQKNG